MKKMNINVNYQKLFLPNKQFVVELSKNYLEVQFNFLNEDWSKCDLIIAILKNTNGKIFKEVLDNNNSIIVKKQVLIGGYFEVSLCGYNHSLNQEIPTDVLTVPVNNSLKANESNVEETTYDKIDKSLVKARLDEFSRLVFTRNNGEEIIVLINDTTYFKGEFTSYEELVKKYPTGETGEYAYVNTTDNEGDLLIKYAWDADSNSWKEYSTDKYVTSAQFQLFKTYVNQTFDAIKDIKIAIPRDATFNDAIQILVDTYKTQILDSDLRNVMFYYYRYSPQAYQEAVYTYKYVLETSYVTLELENKTNVVWYLYNLNKKYTITFTDFENGVYELTETELLGSKLDKSVFEKFKQELKEEINSVKEDISIVEEKLSKISTEVECSHYGEITGNTNDEHGLAIEDQQMLIKKIEGQTLIANNLVNFWNLEYKVVNGVTFTIDKKAGTVLVYGTATGGSATFFLNDTGEYNESIKFYSTHKYLLTGCPVNGSASTYFMSWTLGGSDTGQGNINTNTNGTTNGYAYIEIQEGIFVNNLLFNPQIIDLTLMFGYGNEPTLEEWNAMNLPLISYSEGYILNSKANLVSTSKNVCPRGEWVPNTRIDNGSISQNSLNSNLLNVKIPTVYGVKYYFWSNITYSTWQAHWFDSNDKYLGLSDVVATAFVTPLPNSAYMMITTWTDASIYDTNATPTEYNITAFERIAEPLPYQESNLYVNEELGKFEYIDNYSNTKHSRLKSVDLGTVAYFQAPEGYFISNVSSLIPDAVSLDASISNYVKCERYATTSNDNIYLNVLDKSIGISRASTNVFLNIRDSAFTDAALLKASLSGVMLYYESTEEVVTPLANPLPDGMPVWKNGQQLQVGQLPYTLTKEYSLSLGSQVLANVQIDKEQQEQINELKRDTKVVDKEFKEFKIGMTFSAGYELSYDNSNGILPSKTYVFSFENENGEIIEALSVLEISLFNDGSSNLIKVKSDILGDTFNLNTYTFGTNPDTGEFFEGVKKAYLVDVFSDTGSGLLGEYVEKPLTAQEVYDNQIKIGYKTAKVRVSQNDTSSFWIDLPEYIDIYNGNLCIKKSNGDILRVIYDHNVQGLLYLKGNYNITDMTTNGCLFGDRGESNYLEIFIENNSLINFVDGEELEVMYFVSPFNDIYEV